MKKRCLIVFVLIFFSIANLFSATIELAPYNGANGINIASSMYHNENTTWISGDVPLEGGYTSIEMIGLGGVYQINTQEKNTPLVVTVTCPSGFYLVSQSNPTYRRPFRILLGQGQRSSTSDRVEIPIDSSGVFSEGEAQRKDFYFNENYGSFTSGIAGFWFNMVLDLPGEVDPVTDVLTTEDGRMYPLIEANDYTALVTITISWGEQTKSVTIPFSGYYDRTTGYDQTKGGVASLFVDPYASAAHLSIERDRGNWITVGKVDFLLLEDMTNKDSVNPTFTDSRPLIFASSSTNPTRQSPAEFKLIHEYVIYDTPLTNSNSIGFDVAIRTIEGSNTSIVTFDGTMNIDKANDSNCVAPYYTDRYRHTSSDGNSDGLMFEGTPQRYYSYSGEIDVKLDSGSNVMQAGTYYGSLYIHVIAER